MTSHGGARSKSCGKLEDPAERDHDETIGLESLNSTVLARTSRSRRVSVKPEDEAGGNKMAEVNSVSTAILAFLDIPEKTG